ncbi:DUF4336 domain-containing protein [Nodosilinea sp. LEGE 06152]|uniref:DUF4336 domain-containing protein n=1 Tax=Nodosilinea sp. LEGE 06152 TaxID=2777966 RepID=UPI0018804BA5|nr:DUF4336 domain-containing protein [Nodosilinea sp. LEGE 06152]MBE9160270.1 DUF4336 domain-containing protein [Nodosilinea sp. LEGE 06152]
MSAIASAPSKRRDHTWPFWPVVPLYPYGQRPTLRVEVVKDTVWTFEQFQGIFYVVVPIRMTVVRLEPTGLLVYSPVAPTPECIALLRELEERFGPVKYIIMSTVTGIEHKVFVGPFARRFPQAQVYVTPNQWSFPLNLPLPWLGLPRDRTHMLPADSSQAPFADQVDYAVLPPIDLGLGPFGETACFHRASRTLLLTDAIVAVPEEPPAIVQVNPFPLLFHARDSATDAIVDTPANRRKGWQRIALFAFYFCPSTLEVATTGEMLKEAKQAPVRSRQHYFGFYPFRWRPDWPQSFQALHNHGQLQVAPILQTLIFNRGPQDVLDWAKRVASWQFERIIPAHLAAPISATPEQFLAAFQFLYAGPVAEANQSLPNADFGLLRQIEGLLLSRGISRPRQPAPAIDKKPSDKKAEA